MVGDTIVTFATRATLFVVSAVTGILTARLMGPEGRGIYYLLVTYMGLLVLSGGFGLEASNVYYGAKSDVDRSSLFWNSVFSGAGLGILMIIVGWLVYVSFPEPFRGLDTKVVHLALFSLPWTMVNLFLIELTLGLQDVIYYNFLSAVQRGSVLLFLVLLLPLWPQVYVAMAAHLGAQMVTTGIIVGYFARRRIITSRPRANWRLLAKALSYGVRSQIGNVLLFLNFRLAAFMINFFSDPAQVGVYSIAVILAESLWHVSSSAATVALPRISASQSLARSAMLASRSARLAVLSTAVLAVGMGLISPWVIDFLFGSDFQQAAPALAILLPGIVIFSLEYVLASYIAGRGYPQYVTLVAFIALLVAIGSNLWLVPRWGINGAALASTISYAVATVSAVYFYKRLSGARLSDMLVPTREDWTYLRAYFEDLYRNLARQGD